jgi:HSP20 family molecular chaperone IbpA
MATKQTEDEAAATRQSDQGQKRHSGEQRQADQQAQASRNDQEQRPSQNRGSQTSQDSRLARRDMPSAFMTPFTLLQRVLTDDLASLFDQSIGRRSQAASRARPADRDLISWLPTIDVVQQGSELVVRADVPGVAADDLTVELSEDAMTISGERHEGRADENGGVYRFERAHGAFFREIPLPKGAIVDQAKASFKDGVLEIRVPAPPERVPRGRRLEIAQNDQVVATRDANKEDAPKRDDDPSSQQKR